MRAATPRATGDTSSGSIRDCACAPPGPPTRASCARPARHPPSSARPRVPGGRSRGDAGHFKDPVTGQGMRDAMFAGRTLGEVLAANLDDPAAIDHATRMWEFERDLECLPAYHFATPTRACVASRRHSGELVREAGRNEEPDITDLFGRARTPQQIASLPRIGTRIRASAPPLEGDAPRRCSRPGRSRDGAQGPIGAASETLPVLDADPRVRAPRVGMADLALRGALLRAPR